MSAHRTCITWCLRSLLPFAAVAMPLGSLAAQNAPSAAREHLRRIEMRLEGRLDAATRTGVLGVIDSALAAGLPAELSDRLVSRAFQGARVNAPSAGIIAAVGDLARQLRVAREALATATVDEIDAGAAALQQGASPATLRALRTARPRGSVAVPLVVLVDLVAQGVPPDTASTIILEIARRQAEDAQFKALRVQIASDIGAGTLPVIAASTRARGVFGTTTTGEASALSSDAANGPQRSSPGTTPRPPGGPPPPP